MKVLVTGSSKGIGRQVSVKFLAQGHEVLAGSFGEYLTQIDAIQEELDKVRQLVEKYNI